jgi:hypothetical protein
MRKNFPFLFFTSLLRARFFALSNKSDPVAENICPCALNDCGQLRVFCWYAKNKAHQIGDAQEFALDRDFRCVTGAQ